MLLLYNIIRILNNALVFSLFSCKILHSCSEKKRANFKKKLTGYRDAGSGICQKDGRLQCNEVNALRNRFRDKTVGVPEAIFFQTMVDGHDRYTSSLK